MGAWQGREVELAQLATWLAEPEIQIVGIKAAGGFGKSALAKKLAEKLDQRPDADRFEKTLALTFGQAYPFAVWGRWLMAHFGERMDDGVNDRRLVQRVVQQLEAVRCLLILDNVETLLTADSRQWVDAGYGEFWTEWLSAAGPSVVLVTSREEPDVANNLRRYCRWWLLDGLDTGPGVALLRALDVIGEAKTLDEFVGLAGGHPLLLKLAAGWLLVEEPDEPDIKYLKATGGLNLFELVGAHRRQPETSVQEILEATLARLPAEMAALLPSLSVYRLPFSRAAAAAMQPTGEEEGMTTAGIATESVTTAGLRKLVKRSLLQEKRQSVAGERLWLFEFQPLVQRYLLQRAEGVAHQRAIGYYQQVRVPLSAANNSAARAEEADGTEAKDAEAEIKATIPYREIFHHYCELGQYAGALAAIGTQSNEDDRYSSCDMVLQLYGYNPIRLAMYEQLIEHWQPTDDTEKDLFADALKAQGEVLQFLARRDEALENYAQALGIYRQVGDRLGEANTLRAQGRAQTDPQQGVAYLQLAQSLYEQIEDFYSQGVNLYYLGLLYAQLQQADEALSAFRSAASLGARINFEPLVEAAESAIQGLQS